MANKDTDWNPLIRKSLGEYLLIRDSRFPASKDYTCPGCNKEIRTGTMYCRLKIYRPAAEPDKKKEHIYDVPFHGPRCIDKFLATKIADTFVKGKNTPKTGGSEDRFTNIEI